MTSEARDPVFVKWQPAYRMFNLYIDNANIRIVENCSDHVYSYVDEERSIKDFFETASLNHITGDSIRVTKVDTGTQKIHFDFVSVSDYENCWGTDLPKGTDPGAYTVFYKAVKDEQESVISTVSVTIGMGENGWKATSRICLQCMRRIIRI